jgi:WD40 repeat protein
MLAAVGRFKDVYVLDVSNGKDPMILKGHRESIEVVSFSPDRKSLATGGWDKSV